MYPLCCIPNTATRPDKSASRSVPLDHGVVSWSAAPLCTEVCTEDRKVHHLSLQTSTEMENRPGFLPHGPRYSFLDLTAADKRTPRDAVGLLFRKVPIELGKLAVPTPYCRRTEHKRRNAPKGTQLAEKARAT